MNKKEIGEIAWIIAQIHAGAIDGAFIAGELARICPKAAAESKELMPSVRRVLSGDHVIHDRGRVRE
jgi:hypothetical protein